MYLGIIPIVMRSVMTEHFCSIGLPMLIVDDWRELSSLNEERLQDLYEQLRPGFNSEALWLPYWRGQFENYLGAAG